ncbi:MAG: hypothetical protein FVQ82_13510 [Planctomycetes bacterium]|nr:hypothetical protein [Planctomycetota bacterium]
MIRFEDFAPRMIKSGIFSREFESFDAALAGANEWIEDYGIDVVNIETVVLPQIWGAWEDGGTTDVDLRTGGERNSWHQFIRVWYKG